MDPESPTTRLWYVETASTFVVTSPLGEPTVQLIPSVWYFGSLPPTCS